VRQELVQQRRWLSDQRFLDLFGGADLVRIRAVAAGRRLARR
jgi:hypothetical protein